MILTAWLRDGLVSVFRSISLQSISYNNLHACLIVVSSLRFSYVVVLRLHIRVPIYLWISAPQTMGQYPVSELHLLLNFATLYLMLDCSLTFRHHSHISATTHMILNMFTTEWKMRYFRGFNGKEILPQPPKEKLNGCSRRFCLRHVSPQEISPKKNLEQFNTLCEKHKQQVHLAASKVVNDWHTPDKPAGLTPTRDPQGQAGTSSYCAGNASCSKAKIISRADRGCRSHTLASSLRIRSTRGSRTGSTGTRTSCRTGVQVRSLRPSMERECLSSTF